MPQLSVNGMEIHYEEHGEGIPILGLHGTPGSAVLWEDAARELALHGRCIIYDRRGSHRTHTVLVTGGHLINPTHPAVLDFVDRIASTDTWTDRPFPAHEAVS